MLFAMNSHQRNNLSPHTNTYTQKVQKMSDAIDIPKLCTDFLDEKISYQRLLRSICEYEGWIVPTYPSEDESDAPPALAMLQSSDGKTFLALFSSVELLQQHLLQSNNHNQTPFIKSRGDWILSGLPDSLSAIVINPGQESAVQFTQERFDMLRRWGIGISLEYMLEQDVKQEGAMRSLVDFPLYYVPLFIAEDDSPNFALAPDTDNRTLIAVFTTEDNLDVYLEAAKQKISSNVQIQVMGGQSLFSAIQDLDIDGIVINCLGPSKPHGLALQLINMALLTTQGQPTEKQPASDTQEH
jgi:hypothetical protein